MTSPTSAVGPSLAKVTIEAPGRRMDVALPEDVPLAELLPHILRHAGDDTPDAGEAHGGWTLRRPTGEALERHQTLGAQRVLDGELLRLLPGQVDWPELEYDDLVESIAGGSRRSARSWGRAATRRCGLLTACATLLAATSVTLSFEPPWLVPGGLLLGVGLVLTALGIAVARAVPDARAGAVFTGSGLPYVFLGGLLVTAPGYAGLGELGAPQLLLAGVLLVVFGMVGYLGITVLSRIFVAAVTTGVLAAVGALLALSLDPAATAAVVLTVAIGLLPAYPMMAIRLGRLPLPVLPQRSSDLLEDQPMPKQATVFEAAARTDEILTGLLTGVAVVCAVCAWALLAAGGAAVFMLLAVAAALLLRARLFAVPRQRVPLLVSGWLVAMSIVLGIVAEADGNLMRSMLLLATCGAAVLVSAAGLVYSRKNPSPYLGRAADVLDVLAVLALVPLACYLTGFYAYVQGVMAGIR